MNFLNRFSGVFLNPRETFRAISDKPIWVDAIVILLIVIAVYSYLISPFAAKDQIAILHSSPKIQERMGEERFNQRIEMLENPSQKYILLNTFLLVPITSLIGLLLASLITLGFGRMTSTQGNFRQVFSAFVHANFIDKILGNALRVFLVFSRKSVIQTSTGLALFFPKLEYTSPAYVVLSQVDFFQIWLFGIFGLALSSIFKIQIKKALIISYLFWLLKSIFYIAMTLISYRFMGS